MGNKRKKFSKIYDQYIDKIYRFIFLKVSSKEITQDLCSETFLKGWQAFNKSDANIKNPSAFLYRIARNLIVDHYRQKGRAKFVSLESTTIIDPSRTIKEMTEINSDINNIKTSLADLKEEYQNVIIWHYLDDLSISKVAKLMDKTEGATRVTLHRALSALKDELNKKDIREA